jgi:hypothetical protein
MGFAHFCFPLPTLRGAAPQRPVDKQAPLRVAKSKASLINIVYGLIKVKILMILTYRAAKRRLCIKSVSP